MNLNQMYYYVAVCNDRSFSKAAERIYVSQPTLSKQVAALEAELGAQLINRRTRGMFALTPVGEEYLRAFKRILREYEDVTFRAKLADSENRWRYRIGLMESWLLHDLIRSCTAMARTRFPEAELVFEFLRPGEMTALRRAGKLDLALLRDDVNWPVDGYCWEKIRDIAGVLYVSADNAYVKNGDIPFLELKNETLFSPPGKDMLNAKGHDIFRMMDEQNLRIREYESLASIRMGILASDGFSFADEWSDVVYNPLFLCKRLPDVTRSVLLSRRDEDNSELTRALRDCICTWAQTPAFTT